MNWTSIRDLHQKNRVAWNEAASQYAQWTDRDIGFLRAGGTNFVAPEYRYLKDLKSWCRRAIHLQCAGGRDTLSLWNLGAGEVIGVDISQDMLACAKQKSDALNAPAKWICCDLLDTPHDLDGTADLVYTGRGALCWILDINAWANVAARLLKPRGRLYIFEGHPVTWIWEQDATELRLDPRYGDYFSQNVEPEQGWSESSYVKLPRPREQQAIKHERQWTIGVVMNALIDAGLRVERFEEHPEMYWESFPNLPPDVARRIPQTYSLLMRRES